MPSVSTGSRCRSRASGASTMTSTPEEWQHHEDLVVERLEQHPQHDEDQPALEVVAQELQGKGASLAQLHAHRDADDHGEQRGGEVLRDVEHAAHRAQVRDEHRHDRQSPGGVEAVEAAGRRHAPQCAGRE